MRIVFFGSNFLISLCFLLELWIRYPINHSSSTYGYFKFYCCINAFFLLVAFFGKDYLLYLSIGFILLSGAACFYSDKYNILIDYQVWLDRGMPAWGEVLTE